MARELALEIAKDSQIMDTNLLAIGIDPKLDSLSANLGRTPCSTSTSTASFKRTPLSATTTTTTTTTATSQRGTPSTATPVPTFYSPTSFRVPVINTESLQTVNQCEEALKDLLVC